MDTSAQLLLKPLCVIMLEAMSLATVCLFKLEGCALRDHASFCLGAFKTNKQAEIMKSLKYEYIFKTKSKYVNLIVFLFKQIEIRFLSLVLFFIYTDFLLLS